MRIGNILSIFKNTSKNTSYVEKVISNHLKKNPSAANIKPFCQQFWEGFNLQSYRRSGASRSVTYHGELHGINHHLTTRTAPEDLNKIFMGTSVTPKEIIEITDAEFKVLPKTGEKIIAYRCIGQKPEFFKKDYARYQQCLKLKKGDIVVMPEYAYATSDIEWAKRYLSNDKGIMYILEFEPGSRISITGRGINNEITCPRCSHWECLGTEQKGDLFIPRLRYINPVDYLG